MNPPRVPQLFSWSYIRFCAWHELGGSLVMMCLMIWITLAVMPLSFVGHILATVGVIAVYVLILRSQYGASAMAAKYATWKEFVGVKEKELQQLQMNLLFSKQNITNQEGCPNEYVQQETKLSERVKKLGDDIARAKEHLSCVEQVVLPKPFFERIVSMSRPYSYWQSKLTTTI